MNSMDDFVIKSVCLPKFFVFSLKTISMDIDKRIVNNNTSREPFDQYIPSRNLVVSKQIYFVQYRT